MAERGSIALCATSIALALVAGCGSDVEHPAGQATAEAGGATGADGAAGPVSGSGADGGTGGIHGGECPPPPECEPPQPPARACVTDEDCGAPPGACWTAECDCADCHCDDGFPAYTQFADGTCHEGMCQWNEDTAYGYPACPMEPPGEGTACDPPGRECWTGDPCVYRGSSCSSSAIVTARCDGGTWTLYSECDCAAASETACAKNPNCEWRAPTCYEDVTEAYCAPSDPNGQCLNGGECIDGFECGTLHNLPCTDSDPSCVNGCGGAALEVCVPSAG